jgi:hypothetical protein
LNRKALFVAGIFLAVALIVPPYLLNLQHDADLDDIINQAPNLADETQTQGILEDIDTQYQTIFSIAIATEVIAIILFVIFLWIGLKP